MNYQIMTWDWKNCDMFVFYQNGTSGHLPLQECIDACHKPCGEIPNWFFYFAVVIMAVLFLMAVVSMIVDYVKKKKEQPFVNVV